MLCAEVHPVRLQEQRIPRKVRSHEDGENEVIFIVSIRCEKAREDKRQYTKRILPAFVIPECNIRLDCVLSYLARCPTEQIDYNRASQMLGSGDGRTIDRHISMARQMVNKAGIECAQALAGSAGFGQVPPGKIGRSLFATVRKLVREVNAAVVRLGRHSDEPLKVIRCVHVVYVVSRIRRPLKKSLDQVFEEILAFDTS